MIVRYLVKLSLILASLMTVYLVGWNTGHDVGIVTRQSEDILHGLTVCHYINKKCNADKNTCKKP